LNLKYDTVISIIPFKKEDYRTRRLPSARNSLSLIIFVQREFFEEEKP